MEHRLAVFGSGENGQVRLCLSVLARQFIGLVIYYSRYYREDRLIKTFDQHEDSVYSLAWGSNCRVFGSLSYDGRVLINQVPREFLPKVNWED